MLKSLRLLSFLLLSVPEAMAQIPLEEYYPYAQEAEAETPMLSPDSTLFYRAIQSPGDLFGEKTDFNLSFVAHKRRGQEWGMESLSAGGIEIPYRYLAALRSVDVEEHRTSGLQLSGGITGRTGGVREFRLPVSEPLAARYAAVNFTDRNYLAGVKFSVTGTCGKGWSGAASLHLRTGRDMHVDGVFTNAVSANFRMVKRLDEEHTLSFLLILPASMRGLRSAATEEAFTLLGDRMYNPSWGFQNGKVRNSHVRREFIPLAIAEYRVRLGASTVLAASFGAEYGWRKYSALGWYDARTPLPDNYKYLPSYAGDFETERVWRNNDTRYTQIDWDRLILQNRLGSGQAVYALEDRVERIRELQFDATGTTDADERLTLRYGLHFCHSNIRNYKQMRDLLAARYLPDIDHYLVDDDTYSNLLQNDLRNPGRMIREGDRFGYDYELVRRIMEMRLSAEYRSDRFHAIFAATVGDAAFFRRGHYEKELFPGKLSYGRSRRLKFTPYMIKASAGWAFSPRSYLEAVLAAGAVLPQAQDLFLQPQYNNRAVDNPALGKIYAAELNYRFSGQKISVQLSAFAVSVLEGMQTRRYYDDMSAVFCDMAVTGIGKMSLGIEAAADWRISYRWSLSFAVSAGRYKYVRDPRVTVLSDTDNTVIDGDARSHMGGCTVGGAPQVAGCTEAGYFGKKGWGFHVTASYAGLRYVEPMPLRRTDRIARQGAASEELFGAFTRQERLGDAFTLDASLFKSFRFGRSRLTVSVMFKNLLGSRDMIYGGYESLRILRSRNGDANVYMPFDTRYTYSYPRSFYLSVSYKF